MLIPLTEAEVVTAGPKAATLATLSQAGFPIPPAFVITPDNPQPPHAPDTFSGEWFEGLGGWLGDALDGLGGGAVAVRSSAGGEDTGEGSAAGQYDSFLGAQGVPAVVEAVRATWTSLWSPRAIAYRGSAEPTMAVIVQRQIDAEVAGVLFTGEETVIEASWGLGESVAQGLVTPDSYRVGPDGVRDRRAGDKRTRVDRAASGTVTTAVAPADRHRLCLNDAQLQELHEVGCQVAAHLGGPQDIEFAVAADMIWLLQSRPLTANLPTSVAPTPARDGVGRAPASGPRVGGRSVLHGTPGSAGVATGPARVVRGPEDFGRVRAGDVLVCRCTDPAWTPLFGVVAAVVTEVGGQLSHAAIVARERRIPAVLGITDLMTLLADNKPTTVDGTAGTLTHD